jgi:REP element-mobilizing transposase RayT
MGVRQLRNIESGQYFITFTCYDWLPLFDLVNGYDLCYKWFNHLHSKGHAINAYCIMPNHIHLILFLNEPKQTLNTIVGSGKRFIAYEIVTRLEKQSEYNVLAKMNASLTKSEIKRNKKHRVFEPSFDAKLITSDKMLHEKLTYIHNNPVVCLPALSILPEDYEHSSASFYHSGILKGFQPVHYKENDVWAENKI